MGIGVYKGGCDQGIDIVWAGMVSCCLLGEEDFYTIGLGRGIAKANIEGGAKNGANGAKKF